ncbi:MAG: 50S ribosomal protein L31 [Mycoplasmatota bacterium]
MKKGIHPNYVTTKVECACGNKFEVQSNKETLHLEVCNQCHPAFNENYTGAIKTTGNVQKFNEKYGFTKKEEK